MTREQRLIKKIDSADRSWWLYTITTFGIVVGIRMDKLHWLALVLPLWLAFDVTIYRARQKIQLYTIRLLDKHHEPADDAEENS